MTEDQREAWRKALAAARRGQRQRRGRRVQKSATLLIGPGMIRRSPPQQDDGDSDDSDGPWHD